MANLAEILTRILDGFRQNLASFDRTVELLESCFQSQSLGRRETFIDLLRSALFSEPLPSLDTAPVQRTAHTVILRAWAQFGPPQQLPATMFALLRWGDFYGMERWAGYLGGEFIHSLWTNRERFPQNALDAIKAQCALFTERGAQVTGYEFPQSLIEVAARLTRVVQQIEFERFEQNLLKSQPRAEGMAEDLRSLLASLGLDTAIASAVEQARDYLNSDGPFEPKLAGDLLRTAMDEAHRKLVAELEKVTRTPYVGEDKDGIRRTFMRHVGFITPSEEKFFSEIYALISKEATHKFEAPKETILVMERTVTDYLCLLLRRLSDWKIRSRGSAAESH